MTRIVRRTVWALPLACVLGASCGDGVVEPTMDDRTAVATARTSASIGPNGNAHPSASLGGNTGPNGNANPSATGAQECVVEPAPSGVAPAGEPLPEDLCTIAEFLRNAPNPGAQVVSAFIDEAGGSVRVGDFEIIVPAGAVDRATRFSIKLPPASAARRAFAEFGPHNQDFAVPVTIRLPLSATNADSDAPVTWWSPNGKQWIDQPTSTTSDGRIEAQVGHFSYYGTRLRRGITIAGG